MKLPSYFPECPYHFISSSAICEWFFPTCLPEFTVITIFYFSPTEICAVIFHCGFNLHFSDGWYCWPSFRCWFAICISPLWWNTCLNPFPVFFPRSSVGKESICNAGDLGSIPGLGRSTGEGKGYPLQYSGLENSIDCVVQGVTKSQTRLSNFHFHPQFCNLSFHILTGSFTEKRFLILIQFGVCMCVWVYHAFSVKSKIYLAASLKFLSYVFF